MGLEDDPFSTHITKDGLVRIARDGRVVVTLGGERAARLREALEGIQNEGERQLLLALVTGNYRRGNERRA